MQQKNAVERKYLLAPTCAPTFLPVLNSARNFALTLHRGVFRMKLRPFLRLVLLVTLGSITLVPRSLHGQASSPQPISLDALFTLHEVHDPQISPDGQFVAYTVTMQSLKDDKSEIRIWMLPSSGGDAIPLTAEGSSSEHPRWSPDRKFLAFLSERNEGKTQLYLLNRLGGEAQRLTDTPQNVEDFAWSPDSKRFALILRDASP
jgi:tricorn protease-like protein